MMSLSTISLTEVVKRQYFFKMKANLDSFSSLIWIQLLAMLFSFNSTASMGFSNSGVSVDVKYYTSDVVMVFTIIWSFITAITITTKPYRYHDFTFITNRVSSSLSNILFLVTANLFGALTAMLSHNLLKMIWIFSDKQFYSLQAGFWEHVLGILIAFLYLMLFSSAGYLIGTLVQISKAFIIILSALVIGSLFFGVLFGINPFIVTLYQFYFGEASMLMFLIKVLLSIALFFIASISILNRLEVRK